MSLLTPGYEKNIRNEKIKRLVLLFVVLLICVSMTGVVLMLSSYFVAAFSQEAVLERLQSTKNILEKRDFQKIREKADEINKTIAVFEKNESKRRPIFPILKKIADITPESVVLTLLDLEAKNDFGVLAIKGNAPTREIFLDFVEKLKALPEAESVLSPIANLLKETDVSFTLEFRIKKEIYNYAP